MQYAGNSMTFSPSLAMLAEPVHENLVAFAIYARINLFTIWEYIAIGLAVSSHVRLSKSQGLTFGLIAYGLVTAVVSAFSYVTAMVFS
jgi:hypothetical protein